MKQKEKGKTKSVFEEARERCADLDKLRQAETRAIKECRDAAERYRAAIRKRAEAHADAFVEGLETAPHDPLPEEQQLSDARATLAAIQRRIAALDPELLSLRERLRAAREQHNAEVGTEFIEREFRSAAEQFRKVLRRAHALAASLGVTLTPTGPDGSLHECARPVAGGDWSKQKDACALHAEHHEPQRCAEALARHADDAQRRVLTATRGHDGPATYIPPGARFRTIGTATINGRAFQPGEILDEFDLGGDLPLIGRLLRVRRIALIPPQEDAA